MSLKIRKLLFSVMFVCVAALFAVGCAQQGGGLTQPTIKSQLGHNNIVPSAPSLTVEVTNFCNGQAQVDYGYAVLFCEGKLAALPLSFTTTYGTQVNQDWCFANGYTNANNQLSVPKDAAGNPLIPTLGNCPTGTAPASVTAPSGAAPAKS